MNGPRIFSALLSLLRRQPHRPQQGRGEPRTHLEREFPVCPRLKKALTEMGMFLEYALLHYPCNPKKWSDLSAQFTFWGGFQSPRLLPSPRMLSGGAYLCPFWKGQT